MAYNFRPRECKNTPFSRLQRELKKEQQNLAPPTVFPEPTVPTILEVMSREHTPSPPLRTLPISEDDLKQMVARMIWERQGDEREREGPVRRGTSGIRKPDNFSGTAKSNPSNFIAQYECYGKLLGWDNGELCNAFPLFLADRANAWFSSLPRATRGVFGDLKKAFLAKYEMPRDVQNMSLLHRKQGVNESVEDYSYALSVLFSRSCYPETVQIDLFMAGLKQDYREAVILARPHTLLEAENLAILKEACRQKDPTIPNATMVAQLYSDTKSQQGELLELRRELRSLKYKNEKLEKENSNLLRTKRVEKPQKTVTCHFCGKIGHIVSECRKKQSEQRKNNRDYFVNVCSVLNSSFNTSYTSMDLSIDISIDLSMSSSDESFDSYAASFSESLVIDSSIDQSWLNESLCLANEQKFSTNPNLLGQINDFPSPESLIIDTEAPAVPAIDLTNFIELIQTILYIFVYSTSQLKPDEVGCDKIKIENVQPIKQITYRTSPAQKPDDDNHVEKIIENKIIRPSPISLASSVVSIKKKDYMETQFCLDYRKLKYVTLKDSFPLPKLEETLAPLHNNVFSRIIDLPPENRKLKYLTLEDSFPLPKLEETLAPLDHNVFTTTSDLRSCYHKVRQDEPSEPLKTFSTQTGLFTFNNLHFGSHTSPASFQRIMGNKIRTRYIALSLSTIMRIIMFITTLFSILTAANVPEVGPVFDCTKVSQGKIYQLDDDLTCDKTIGQKYGTYTTFHAKVQQYYLTRTPLKLYQCSHVRVSLTCKENFFASKERHIDRDHIRVSAADCLEAERTLMTIAGKLHFLINLFKVDKLHIYIYTISIVFKNK